ncbi:BQ2448_4686 [Microbotryum intermedium]|uniref:assimilatory sulfite reductase (NADPH) n=1 Tax=Microbotryum intermedium TaxID=269621 RepID=A0A238FDT9_9BASI|nr:BQ2448_4686 [Microbotryum intermedium]
MSVTPSTQAIMQSLHQLLEADAAQSSSAVFVYDTTPSAAFGESLIRSRADSKLSSAEVHSMQTRAGAGSLLVGFVESIAFTSKGAQSSHSSAQAAVEVDGDATISEASSVPAKRASRARTDSQKKAKTSIDASAATSTVSQADKPIVVLSSTDSFLALAPSLLSLPRAGVRPALTVHVSAQISSVASDEQGVVSLTQVPALGSLFEVVKTLDQGGWTGAVVLSETAEQAALVGTALAHRLNSAGHDLVNVFDGLTAGRQLSVLNPASASASAAGESAISSILTAASIPYFSYFGSANASRVLVIPASTYSATAKAAIAQLQSAEVGLLVVRVVKPWDARQFHAALPSSAKSLHVFAEEHDEQSSGPFYDDILGSLILSGLKLKVRAVPVPASSLPSVHDWISTIVALSSNKQVPELKSLLPAEAKLAIFWDLDATPGQTETVPLHLASAFAAPSTGIDAKLAITYDNFRQGGIQQASLLLEPLGKATKDFTVAAVAATSAASLLFLSSPAVIFKAYEPISSSSVGRETRIVISANWTAEEVATKLPYSAKKALAAVAGSSNLFVIDTDKIAAAHSIRSADIAEIVFWSLYLPSSLSAKEIVGLLAQSPSFGSWEKAKLVEVNGVVRNAITQVTVESSWAEESMAVDGEDAAPVSLPTSLIPTAAGPNPDRTFAEPVAEIVGKPKDSWHNAAQRFLFPESFELEKKVDEKMRPDLPEKNFLITVSENRRLTPSNYDRYVFHLEFDTAGTGLKYAIGEALGVHGWNDGEETLDFLKWYGLDPDAVISVPSRLDPSRVEQRTVFQVFQQNLDIFGKPGKSFYEILSRYATNKNEERALHFIACPDGHATFKKMSEMDTVTYADLLRQFPSARPTVADLVREIEPIHPRHYSVSSSQNFVGDAVHLLVVTVEWNTPKGSQRFGQCTRYLAGLKAGDQVMVSIKPSVMKLPALDEAPVIMAGLGTGAAPFRAFIQERAWRKEQGYNVGPMLYYFGSRHRSEEYLYGFVLARSVSEVRVPWLIVSISFHSEEIEAYLQEGIVTKTGLAFSRDTAQKVYIQHKMNEDADMLAKMLENGAFYLCGPTWPAADVFEALCSAFVKHGRTREQAEAYIEELKEKEAYVLEVY